MSTAYRPSMPAFDGHALHGYPSAMAPAGRPKTMADEVRSSRQRRLPPQQQMQLVTNAQTRSHAFSAAAPFPHPTSRPSTRTSTPIQETKPSANHDGPSPRRGSDSLIYHSLQIPPCISPNGGNLSDLAAQMTCLFWFDSVENLAVAESIRSKPPDSSMPRLPTLARPYDQFRKWVYNVLSTTQVTQNVIFLALLFIYRLKMSTPQIKGRAGSEYRLLTVALMLGNKFLDDNTYTNKTWAEVSCFAVQEIHVMEVEFLSNMRYNLLTSKEEWEGWLAKLACFHEYYTRAAQLPASPVHVPSPTNKAYTSPIPSPTSTTLQAIPSIHPFASSIVAFSPNSSQPKKMSTYRASNSSPPVANTSGSLGPTRKRSPEDGLADHPAKRHAPPRAAPQASAAPAKPRLNGTLDSRPPVPSLTAVAGQGQNPGGVYSSSGGYGGQLSSGANQHLVSLPPLQHGARAMSTVYQANPTTTMTQATMSAATCAPMPTPTYSLAPPGGGSAVTYGTPTKHHSPGALAPFGSSPLAEAYGTGSAVHTPISNSPSVYLQQRASPYKPVRHVNTLLYPPPSASLDQYHLSMPMQPNQMHYQPLGRRHDVRTGVVPEFVMYNRGQQRHVPTQGGGPLGHFPS